MTEHSFGYSNSEQLAEKKLQIWERFKSYFKSFFKEKVEEIVFSKFDFGL